MTASVPPMGPEAFAVDAERELEAYAASVRIVASGAFLRRIEASVAQERAAATTGPLRRARAWLTGRDVHAGRAGRAGRAATGPRVAGVLIRPSLVALLLLVLALGAAVGGAGAVVVSLLQAPQPAPAEPVDRVVPDPTLSTPPLQRAIIAPDPDRRGSELVSPLPAVRVDIQSQRDPDGPRHRRHVRHAGHVRHLRRPAHGQWHPQPGSFHGVSGTIGRTGCDRRGDDAALPPGTLVLPRTEVRRCAF